MSQETTIPPIRKYDIVVPIALKHTQRAVCTPPWFVQETEYPPVPATYLPLVNGEEAFKAVHLAIARARHAVDIVCWGFQPSMYLIRGWGSQAPCLGELLMEVARKGVQVRILGWEMPFNSAGVAGEANLPGKGTIRIMDRALQHSTEEQYAFDRQWFSRCAAGDNIAAALREARNIPIFVSRGFDLSERVEINYQARRASLDPRLSVDTQLTLTAAPTHHQKMVLVDYECPEHAIGFVMGHNLLDEYWDTDEHSALRRSPESKPAPHEGPRGDTPRQDISSQVSGPILEHLHHNFASAWRKETGEDLLALRDARHIGPFLQFTPGLTRQMAQVLRTQPQEGKRDIEQAYLQAVNNATRFIYIENQYFRWPPLAELIKSVAETLSKAGRDPGRHGALHLFVVTNATNDGIGAGTVNTHRMLESLGRGDTMPAISKLRLIEKARAEVAEHEQSLSEMLEEQALIKLTSLIDALGGTDASAKAREAAQDRVQNHSWRHMDLNHRIREIEESTLTPQEHPGLKVHVCSLVASKSPPGTLWMPVYIHSKLMIVDDTFTTHGSANINTRSMQVDSELNIAHEWASVTQDLRRRLWTLHTAGRGVQDDPEEAFKAWQKIINKNKRFQKKRMTPSAPLVEFYYNEAKLENLD